VSQGTREIGIRMALGATPSDVVGMVLRSGMMVAGIGLGAGVAAALLVSRFMQSLLFQVKPTDAATFISIAVLLAVIAFIATYGPARRAARVDPLTALRTE
jgi:putative ABC transport system permease protein